LPASFQERFLGTCDEWWWMIGCGWEMSTTKLKRDGKERSTWSTSNSKRIDAAEGVNGVALALYPQRLAVEPDAHALTGCKLSEVLCYLFRGPMTVWG